MTAPRAASLEGPSARCVAALLLFLSAASSPLAIAQPASYSASTHATGTAPGGADPIYIPDLSKFVPAANSRESLSASLQIVAAMTLLTLAPSIILMMTCFVRIVIVLSLLRQALGTQQLPPSQIITGLSIFLTLLVMAPTGEKIRVAAIDPYLNKSMPQMQAVGAAGDVLRDFMFDQIEAAENVDDVYLMYEYAKQRSVPDTETLQRSDVPLTALIPAFMLSELKAAFVLGFRIYLPFLVIDMVIATILVSMGMMMLPPVLISLPFKLLLFVLADGWHLVAGSLMASVALPS